MTRADRKLNLLIVVAGLGIGGAEVVIQHIAQTIDRNRFNVTICCIRVLGPIGEKLIAQGVDVVVLGRSEEPRHGYLAFLKLWKLIRARNIDIVHTHTTDALFDAALCKLLSSRVRLIHTFHFGNYPHRDARHRLLEKSGALFADLLVAVGDEQRLQIIATYGFRPESIHRVWNGVEASPVLGSNAFRARLGVTDQVLIGVTATLIEQKGLFDFLDVACQFRDQSDHTKFVIVGEGKLRPLLEKRHRDLNLGEQVILAGWVPHANIEALPAFDIFFQPSLWEAMSIALLEAMAAAKAIVTTRVGEASHIINHGVDGFLVDPKDVTGMVALLKRLVDAPRLREQMGAAARKKVAEQFTVEQMTRTYEELYANVFQGKPRIRYKNSGRERESAS